jgi:CheY-like chemotaxis protein
MKKKREELQTLQAQKLEALGHFAGGIAHDFNNILSIIEGYTHIALRQMREGTLTPLQLEKILASTQRGAGLTRQLLAFARQKVDIESTASLTDTLRQQQVLLKPLLGETVHLHLTLPAEDVWVKLSGDQITQIVLNIALNARDAMPQGGDLVILCHKVSLSEGPFVRMTFVDSGAGISKDVLPRIFDPFFTTKSPTKGTGLGLSVVHGIVNQAGGKIEARSKPGEGTTFQVYLPFALTPAATPSPEGPEFLLSSLEGKTILIAEDEPELLDVLAFMMSDMKMKVLTASNGNHALRVQEAYKGTIDFLLTDVVMPEMDGVHLGGLFETLRPDTNVVYMSGYPFLDGGRNWKLPSDASFISKPMQEGNIRLILERALQRRDERIKGEDNPQA